MWGRYLSKGRRLRSQQIEAIILEEICISKENGRLIPVPCKSQEEVAAIIEKAFSKYEERILRMQTDPIYRKQKRKEERKFNRYMFFHDYWTFKRYLSALVRFFQRRCFRKKA